MRSVILLACAALLAGCTSISSTRSLGSLQAEFGDLVRSEQACASGDAGAGLGCLGSFDDQFRYVEVQASQAVAALEGSEDRTDRQIGVGLYRLAALASWQAGSGNAAALAASGRALCAELGTARPPRDCALLEVIGYYEQADRFAAEVGRYRAGDPEGRDLSSLAGEFCPQLHDRLVAATQRAEEVPFLEEGVRTYLQRQLRSVREQFLSLHADVLEDVPLGDRPRRPCACDTGSAEPVCEGLDAGVAEVMCIRAALRADPPRCP
jgi:hypothetical protein